MGDDGAQVEKAILAIDGGGIRGAIPAVVLCALEERAKRPLHELFDVIAGTSTGGILALGLAWPGDGKRPPYTASALLDLYREDGPTIFPHEFLGRLRQLFGPKYPARGREKVLRQHFGQARLSDALTEVIVTSYDIESRRPVFFRVADAKGPEGAAFDFAMSDVAMATSAAPTYFPPVRLPDPGHPGMQMTLVDGGVFANDPGMCGFVDRTTVQGRAGATLMVSLGTGRITKPLPYSHARRWGLLGWGGHILDVVFDGVTESVDYELSQVLGADYHRLQVTLSKDEAPMDRTGARNVERLIALAESLVEQQSTQLDQIVSRLLQRRGFAP
jgi:uncharacterized protein